MMNVTAFNLLLDLVRNSDWMTLMPLSTLAGDLEDLALREVVNSNVIAEYFVVRSAAAKFNEAADRSEEHTSELQSLMRISYAVFCLKKKNIHNTTYIHFHNLIPIRTKQPN